MFEPYLDLLIDNFNAKACAGLMCRHQVSVGWDGSIYDCDFNQALGLRAHGCNGAGNIVDYAADPDLPLERQIAFGNHCYACTAGFWVELHGHARENPPNHNRHTILIDVIY